ncbi:type II 3-dehydroquinate dehydratase [bacterium]|nr:type II 3-dehydroquinate dehydratase [bacterium]
MKFLVINGVNLNLLGSREPDVYGSGTLKDLEDMLRKYSADSNFEVEFWQSNIEGEIVEKIQSAQGVFDGIVLNAGAYTHTSVAIRDAISAISVPCVEVHISNIYKREDFRHESLIAPVCIGQITGFGFNGYKYALDALYSRKGA